MHNFARALRIAFAHRVNLVGCVLTSLLIAVLWGGNLTAVFPVVDVIMNDQSLPQWIDEKIEESDREVVESSRWLVRLESIKSSTPEQIQNQIRAEIGLRHDELKTHRKRSANTWNDVQIAEKTRLENHIKQLIALQAMPPADVVPAIEQEIRETQRHIRVYSRREARFRWIAPAAHRWMPTTPFRTLLVVCLFVLVCTIVKGVVRVWNGIIVARWPAWGTSWDTICVSSSTGRCCSSTWRISPKPAAAIS
jgi:ATP-binding cassette subfamily B protein/subfamily B ATP-binding cassette protein MsbA